MTQIFIYQQNLSLARNFWTLAVLLGIAMVLGTWTAKRFIERLPPQQFKRYIAVLLMAVATYMVIHG